MRYRLDVNGTPRDLDMPRGTTLLEALRDDLGLVAARYGCGRGQCGGASCSPMDAPSRRV